MRTPALALTALLLSSTALAWTPALDEATAKSVVDGAYRRGPVVPTAANLSLAVVNGAFEAGAGVVSAYSGGEACVTDWLQKPVDFAMSSRPSQITVVGQADYAYGAALAARDNFQNLTPAAAVETARKTLPDGNLHVFVKIEGLKTEQLRDSYNVAVLDSTKKIRRPYRVTFLQDWKRTGEGQNATYSGTMTYYFDLSDGAASPTGVLPLLLQTENAACAYRINLDLASFK